jgi:hypothetical protein
MRRTVLSFAAIAALVGLSMLQPSALADGFTVNFHNLDATLLAGGSPTGNPHHSLIVYQEVRGSSVSNVVNAVLVNAPKAPRELLREVDLDDDGQITFRVDLEPTDPDRTIVIVAQRFGQIGPSSALPFVIVSQGNSLAHVLNIAVPVISVAAAPSKSAQPPKYQPRECGRHRCFLFRRRCR